MFKISRSIASFGTVLALILGSLGVASPVQAAVDEEGNGVFDCWGGGTYTVANFVLTGTTNCSGTVVIDDSVSNIGANAFKDVTEVDGVRFGQASMLVTIEASAFEGATGLTSIVIPQGVIKIGSNAFSANQLGESSFTSITFLGTKPTIVGDNPFAGTPDATAYISPIDASFDADLEAEGWYWKGLTVSRLPGFGCSTRGYVVQTGTAITSQVDCAGTANIPSGVTSVANSVFRGNTTLFEINFPASLTSIGQRSFEGASSLATVSFSPDSLLTNIAAYAFSQAGSLTSIAIPASVELINRFAFYQTTSLASVSFEPGSLLNSIEASAFEGAGFSSIALPVSLEWIRDRAFFGSQLASITIPANVLTTGDRTFGNCVNLTSINVDPENNYNSSVDGVLFHGNNELVAYPVGIGRTSYRVPAGISNIGPYAFSGATYLETIDFAPASQYSTVQARDFADIPFLTQLLLPGTVTKIEGLAFSGSERLDTLAIPSSVTRVASDSFDKMLRLSKLGFLGNAPTYGGGDESEELTFEGEYKPQLFKSSTASGFGSESSWKGLTLYTVDFISCSVSGYAVVFLNVLVESESCTGELTVPNTVTEIYPSAFQNSSSLTGVIFEPTSSLTKIGASAFDGALSLSSITIPASVTEIGLTAFGSCLSLSSITVEAANNFYSSPGGVLFDKSQTQLIAYPVSSTRSQYVIPGTVFQVAKRAFYEARNLTKLTIPASVGQLGELAMANTSISNFTFGGNAPAAIGVNAFLGSPDGAQANVSATATDFGMGELWNGLSVVRARARVMPISTPPVVSPPAVLPAKVVAKALSLKQVVLRLLANGVPVLKGRSASASVEFTASSARLDATDWATLRKVATNFKGKNGKLILVGFVKNAGQSKTSAQKVSAARAKNVASALISLGIDFEVGYAGFGPRNKLNPKATDNRVDFRWIASQ